MGLRLVITSLEAGQMSRKFLVPLSFGELIGWLGVPCSRMARSRWTADGHHFALLIGVIGYQTVLARILLCTCTSVLLVSRCNDESFVVHLIMIKIVPQLSLFNPFDGLGHYEIAPGAVPG